MPTLSTRILLPVLLLLGACSMPDNGGSKKAKAGDPMATPAEILGSGMSFMIYKRDFLKLTMKYKTYDTAGHPISKAQFLQSFAAASYFPLRIISDDSTISYKLYPLPDTTSGEVRSAIKYYGEVYNTYYKREGERFPVVNFTDVYGTAYNNESFKGKTVVLKFWFIHCGACVAEMPRLNELVKEYSHHQDVLFLSLAYDTKEQLINFLKNTAFRYATIPVSEAFVLEDMKINAFPTHMILKDGVITSISNDAEELVDALHEAVPVK